MARRLLARRSAFVLDEPTEHLDRETAKEVEATIARETSGVASLVISHQVVGNVDRVIEMDSGRVVASGTHEELMNRDGWYARQVLRQRDSEHMADVIAQLPAGIAVSR